MPDNPHYDWQRVAMRILYLIHEPWPTYRSDVSALFGRHLPAAGLCSDIVTEAGAPASEWPGGRAILHASPDSRAFWYLSKFWHNMRALGRARRESYDAIQVRDMPLTAVFALIAARLIGVPFFYWMSFPKAEAQSLRASARGPRAGLRYLAPLVQGWLGARLLYRIVLKRADHVFVQSQMMLDQLAARGVPPARMTPVPMGVDAIAADPSAIPPKRDPGLEGKRVVAYLGTLDPERGIELLIEALALARRSEPALVLVLAGDSRDRRHLDWLKMEAERHGVADAIVWTGWLPTEEAWGYARAAEIGLSPIPRGPLLDVGSPTKAIEYMSLKLPVVGNDNPDQALVIRESGAGLCVELEPAAFAVAITELLGDAHRCREMGERGRAYVLAKRDYARIAEEVAAAYRAFAPRGEARPSPTIRQ